MLTYKYKGITKTGTKTSGVTKAYNEYEAVTKLRETLSIITKIEEVKAETGLNTSIGGKKIKEKELALMCSQFSIILAAGLPVTNCVEMVAAQMKNKELRRALQSVADDISAGYTMAQGFENCEKEFPKTFIETVRAGEQSGTLEACFARLHAYFDKAAKTKAKVVSTLTYPAIVICVAIIVFIIIMVFAVPMFSKTFEEMGTELPGITKALIGVSRVFTDYWWILIGGAAILVGAYIVAKRSEQGKLFISKYSITKSPFNKINSMSNAATFATTLSTMLSAGLPLVNALGVTASVVQNYTFSIAVRKVKEGVERGRSISECMKEIEYFPKMLTEMTGVGEKSGSLTETLDVVGDFFTNEVDMATARLLALLEPAITVGLAVITVILLLAVYLPMFSMYGSI